MKNIVMLSGGIDSAVALSLAIEDGPTMAVSYDYGQANRRELDVAERLARHYEVSRRVIMIDTSHAAGKCAALGGDDIARTFVPGRNLIFISYAISVAESVGASAVWFGANADDHGYYPDCRPAFAQCMSLAAELGTQHGGIRVVAPLMPLSKREVVQLGQLRMVPLAWTTTCAQPVGGDPCGECRGCCQRKDAGL